MENKLLAPFEIKNEQTAGHDIPLNQLQERARQVKRHPSFTKNVAHAVANRYPPWETSEHVEKRIYEGFPSRSDSNLMEKFHARPWDERLEITSKLEDDRLKELGERLIYVERTDALPEEVKNHHDTWLRNRLLADGDVPWVTIDSAFEELKELNELDDGGNAELLSEIEVYLKKLGKASSQ